MSCGSRHCQTGALNKTASVTTTSMSGCVVDRKSRISANELIARLRVEEKIWLGCPEFIIFLLFVSFQIWALTVSGASTQKHEIYSFLSNHLGLESIADAKSSPELWDFIKVFSQATKALYPLSHTYTSDPEQVFLVSGLKEFNQEEVYPANTHPVIRASFSFSAWVDRQDAALIRKVIQKASGDEITCWEWAVSSFRYGGHDWPADLLLPTVRATFEKGQMGNGQLSLVNFVVAGNATDSKATFYLNSIDMGSTNLKYEGFIRPVTDCEGGKMILGANGMRFSMSDLKYFPRALTPVEIKDIFEKGQPISEIVTASRVGPVQRSMEESIEQIIEHKTDTILRRIDQRAAELKSLSIVDVNAEPPSVQTRIGPDHVLAGETRWLDGEWDVEANGTISTNGQVDFTKPITVSFWILQRKDSKSVVASLEGVHKQCFFIYCRGLGNQLIMVINGMRTTAVTGTNTQLSSVNFDNAVWRHVAISVRVQREGLEAYSDVSHLSSIIYLDGAEVVTNPSGSFHERGAKGDCSSGKVLIGARGDGAYTFSGSVRDIRMYPRILSALEVRSLSEAHRTCAFAHEVTDDMSYRSPHGYGCAWYFTMKQTSGVDHCDAVAYGRCPNACGSAAFCFEPILSPLRLYSRVQWSNPVMDGEVFFTYSWRDGIERDANYGRLCIDSSLAASVWENACAASGITELDYQFDLHLRFGAQAKLPTPVSCKVSRECSWDALDYGSMFDITSTVTIYWWALGGGHLAAMSSPGEFCFQQYGKYLYFRSGQEQSDTGYFTATSHAEFNRWVMKAVSFGPSRVTFCIDGECRTQKARLHCPLGIHGLLLGNARISPIVITPVEMSQGQLQTVFYNEREHYNTTVGPRATDAQMRETTQIEIEHFPLKTFLAAPPVIVQTRKTEAKCSSSAESEQMLHEQAIAKCAAPYACEYPETWVPCWGGSSVDSAIWKRWAIHGVDFQGQWVYPEFLYTLDNAILMRDGRQVENSNFINSGTRSLKLVVVLSTPNLHITSVLTVAANLDGNSISADVDLRHVRSIVGDYLTESLTVSAFAMFFGLLLMLLEFRDVHVQIKVSRQDYGSLFSKGALVALVQLLFSAAQVAFIAFRMNDAYRSEKKNEDVLGPLYQIQWLEHINIREKVDRLFSILNRLLGLTDRLATHDTIAFFILCVLFLRMPMYQMMHARVASFPITLGIALEDLMHFLIPSVSMFLLLAGGAHWSFGESDELFSTMPSTMDTQLKMLTGDFPFAPGNESFTKFIYFMTYIGSFFFIFVNFLLAIIVDSYVEYKESTKQQAQQFNFGVDAILCLWQYGLKAPWYGWPSIIDLTHDLRSLEGADGGDGEPMLTEAEFLLLPSVARCKNGAGSSFWAYYTSTYDLSGRVKPEEGPGTADLDPPPLQHCLSITCSEVSGTISRTRPEDSVGRTEL